MLVTHTHGSLRCDGNNHKGHACPPGLFEQGCDISDEGPNEFLCSHVDCRAGDLIEGKAVPYVERMVREIEQHIRGMRDAKQSRAKREELDYLYFGHIHPGPQCGPILEELNDDCRFREIVPVCRPLEQIEGADVPEGGPWYVCFHVSPAFFNPAEREKTEKALKQAGQQFRDHFVRVLEGHHDGHPGSR